MGNTEVNFFLLNKKWEVKNDIGSYSIPTKCRWLILVRHCPFCVAGCSNLPRLEVRTWCHVIGVGDQTGLVSLCWCLYACTQCAYVWVCVCVGGTTWIVVISDPSHASETPSRTDGETSPPAPRHSIQDSGRVGFLLMHLLWTTFSHTQHCLPDLSGIFIEATSVCWLSFIHAFSLSFYGLISLPRSLSLFLSPALSHVS